MHNPFRASFPPLLFAAALALSGPSSPLGAQDAPTGAREPADAPVAALPVALYNAQANVIEDTDSAKAVLATSILESRLTDLLGDQLVPRQRTVSAANSDPPLQAAGGQSCSAIVACARAVGQAVDAKWVVMAKVSKTSNLIWLFTGQLVHVPSGDIVLDDSTELKGDPEPMVRAGTRIFAERVARTVRSGGVTTNYPAQP